MHKRLLSLAIITTIIGTPIFIITRGGGGFHGGGGGFHGGGGGFHGGGGGFHGGSYHSSGGFRGSAYHGSNIRGGTGIRNSTRSAGMHSSELRGKTRGGLQTANRGMVHGHNGRGSGTAGYGHHGHPGWHGHRGFGYGLGYGIGWWPLYSAGLFLAGYGYYCWRPGWGWGWWPEMYNDNPYIIVDGQRVLDEPWWTINNRMPYTITVSNGDGSDEVDIDSNGTQQLMFYGSHKVTITFPDGYKTTITPSKNNITIQMDKNGDIVMIQGDN